MKNFSVNPPFSKGMAARERRRKVILLVHTKGKGGENGCLVFLSSSREKEEGMVWVFIFILFYFFFKKRKRKEEVKLRILYVMYVRSFSH